MNDPTNDTRDANSGIPPRRPFQFGLGALLAAVTAAAVLLGALRGFGASPWTMALVLGLLAVGALAAVALLAAITSAGSDDDAP